MSDPADEPIDAAAFDAVQSDVVEVDEAPKFSGEYEEDFDEDEDEEDERQGVELRVDHVDDPIEHLLRGEVEVEGRMPYSSNATFLVHVEHEGKSHPAIYKPMPVERIPWRPRGTANRVT